MKITKLGHCCLLIEQGGLRFLTDPGAWTESAAMVKNIDAILITHEHADHLHVPAIIEILKSSQSAEIFAPESVKGILVSSGISSQAVKDGDGFTFKGVSVSVHGVAHAEIHPELPSVQNCGFLVGSRFFYPGDAFTKPEKAVEILALPVAGPWLHLKESIEYATALAPKKVFPVHDGMLKFSGPFHIIPEKILGKRNIPWQVLGSVAEDFGN